MTVAELGRRMSAAELVEWMAADRLAQAPPPAAPAPEIPADAAALYAQMESRADEALEAMKRTRGKR